MSPRLCSKSAYIIEIKLTKTHSINFRPKQRLPTMWLTASKSLSELHSTLRSVSAE